MNSLEFWEVIKYPAGWIMWGVCCALLMYIGEILKDLKIRKIEPSVLTYMTLFWIVLVLGAYALMFPLTRL